MDVTFCCLCFLFSYTYILVVFRKFWWIYKFSKLTWKESNTLSLENSCLYLSNSGWLRAEPCLHIGLWPRRPTLWTSEYLTTGNLSCKQCSVLVKSELDSGSKFGFQTLSRVVYNIFLFLGVTVNLNNTFLHLGKEIGRGESLREIWWNVVGTFQWTGIPAQRRGKIFMCHATETGVGCGNFLSYFYIWTWLVRWIAAMFFTGILIVFLLEIFSAVGMDNLIKGNDL